MNLVNKDGTLAALDFTCNESGKSYSVTATRSTYGGENPFKDSAWLALDTIKREDGKTREFTRREMASRFQNVTIREHKPYDPKPQKKKTEKNTQTELRLK